MNILHVIGGGDVGGAKTHVLSLVSKLSENNKVVLVSLREGEFAEDARRLGIDTRVIKNKNPLKDFSDLLKLIKKEKFDIVHCHGAKANVIATVIKCRITAPVITTVHSDYRRDYMGSVLKRLTNGLMNTVALRFLDAYIGVTSAFAKILTERGFDPYMLYTLNNGIDFSERSPKISREEYLKKLGIESENPVVCGIAARFDPVKDIPTAIKAFAKAAQEFSNLYLVLGGDGEEAGHLRILAKDLGVADRVIFAGWIDDMDSFLNCVDISIISSVSEGFPYSVLEAIRARCTMVSTKVGALPEVIADGEDGLLFEIGDADGLCAHIKYLCENPDVRHAMAEKLLRKACVKYSFDAMVRNQISIYEAVLSKRENKPKKIVVCGSYGRGNAGDDAILKAVVSGIYEVDPSAEVCVMSKDSKQTSLRYKVKSIYTFNIFRMFREMRSASLYINGGGSLIQDSTSSRSLYFYLFTIIAAKFCRCSVMMYGCGIGPVRRKFNRRLAARIIEKNVDCVTLRDPDSYDELIRMGIRKPRMFLAADPTLEITPVSADVIENVFEKEGLSLSENYLCLALRNWKNIDEKLRPIAESATYAAEKYNLKIVLIPMERAKDMSIAERIKKLLPPDSEIIRGEYDVHTVIGILSRMRIIMAMRLHALVFGAGQGVATIGIAYDHKVTGFMNYIGREMCTQYEECSADVLKNFIDRTMSDTEYEKNMQSACQEMRENEKENLVRLSELLKEREV